MAEMGLQKRLKYQRPQVEWRTPRGLQREVVKGWRAAICGLKQRAFTKGLNLNRRGGK